MKKNEIEELLGLNRTTIYKWEKGEDEKRKLLSRLLLSIPTEYLKGDLLFNDTLILQTAKKYYDDMRSVYSEAIEMGNGLQFYRKEISKRKDAIYKILPAWLIDVLDSLDFYNIEILINKQNSK